jgi:hypothetical protein
VEGVGSKAAMEDVDEPVREGPQSLVVGGSASALPVVEGAGARGVVQRREPLAPGELFNVANPCNSSASWRRLHANRASTTRLVPEALVIGDMPE